MSVVIGLARRRIGRHWRGWLAAGVVLGLGFGLCLASVLAARRTASAYDRVLVAADAEDATLASHGRPAAETAAILDGIDGIVRHRYQAGFVGVFDGIDPVLSQVLLASADDGFVVELPRLTAGRLPNPARADEVFVNEFLAEEAGLELGQQLDLTLTTIDGSGRTEETTVTVVGIGTLPRDAVGDETEVYGLTALTRAFHEEHTDLVAYSSSIIDLAPGLDAQRDVAPALADVGFELSESRSQDRHAASDALRPLVTILAAFALLVFVASAVAAGQFVQRDQERWRGDDDSLAAVGIARWQVVAVRIATSIPMALVAVALALVAMAVASPVAPLGPLHAFDPDQGFTIDATVALAGAFGVVATITGISAGFAFASRTRRSRAQPGRARSTRVRRPEAIAGLTLALRGSAGRWRAWRSVCFATAAVLLVAAVTTLVVAAVKLSDTRSAYGVTWDVVAVNAYGAQDEDALQQIFGGDDVDAAAGFTGVTFLVDDRAVPGVAVTDVKGELRPTLLRGDPVRADDEIALGQDTLDTLGVDVGDRVEVQTAGGFAEAPDGPPADLRVVGVVTFPAIVQPGTDQARLGTGALVTREAFDRMIGSSDTTPQWTGVRVADGVDPATIIAANPEGIPDRFGSATSWFTDAEPAEIRQMDAVRGLLVAAILVTYLVALVVIGHALWSQTRGNQRDLGVLRVLGLTRRQLAEVVAWQAAPLGLATIVVGIPLGFLLGRRVFSWFADSLAVVDHPITPLVLIVVLVAATLVAVALGMAVAMRVARRSRTAVLLREM